MNIVIFDKKTGRSRSIPLRGARFVALATLCVATVAGISGFITYQWDHTQAKLEGRAFEQDLRKQLAADVEQNEVLIRKAKQTAEQEMAALTIRVAELQARLLRIDALGERLVNAAGFEKGEFDFSATPAVGGPSEELASDGSLPDFDFAPPSFLSALEELNDDVLQRHEQLALLQTLLASKKLQTETNMDGRPIKLGWMSSPFGKRIDPFSGRQALHKGMDFAGKEGSPILSVGSGVVTWAGKRFGYGLMVEVNHGGGYATRYGHAKEVKVKVGDLVTKGQEVATIGSSGRSTGPHVHIEVHKNGKPVNPAKYITVKAK